MTCQDYDLLLLIAWAYHPQWWNAAQRDPAWCRDARHRAGVGRDPCDVELCGIGRDRDAQPEDDLHRHDHSGRGKPAGRPARTHRCQRSNDHRDGNGREHPVDRRVDRIGRQRAGHADPAVPGQRLGAGGGKRQCGVTALLRNNAVRCILQSGRSDKIDGSK